MRPRLTLDIGWSALIGALFARGDARAEARLAALAPEGVETVVGLSPESLFDAVLGASDLRAGGAAVFSALGSETLAATARAHGLRLDAVDVEFDTLTPRPDAFRDALRLNTRLAVLSHPFGAECDVEPLARLARARGLLVVEDRTQGFDGELRLSPGVDVTLYGFGLGQTHTALGGAVALIRDADLAGRVREVLARRPVAPRRWWLTRVGRAMLLKLVCRPALYGLFAQAADASGRDVDQVTARLTRAVDEANLLKAVRRRPPGALVSLMARRLTDRFPTPAMQHRRAKSEALARDLALSVPVPGRQAPRHAWSLLPVMTAAPDKTIDVLRASGFDATRFAQGVKALTLDPRRAPPVARRIMAEAVFLPDPSDMDERTRKRLVGAVLRGLPPPPKAQPAKPQARPPVARGSYKAMAEAARAPLDLDRPVEPSRAPGAEDRTAV